MEFVELDTEHGEAVKRADPGEPCCACPEGGGHAGKLMCQDFLASLSPPHMSKAISGDARHYPSKEQLSPLFFFSCSP